MQIGFCEGYALYAFDLTSDLSDNESFNLARYGTVRIDMSFGAALASTVTVVAFAECENILEMIETGTCCLTSTTDEFQGN